MSCNCQGRCGTSEARALVSPLSQPCERTTLPAPDESDVAAQEGDATDDDNFVEGYIGAKNRRGYGRSETDGWAEDYSLCVSGGSHGESGSISQLKDCFDDVL